MSENNVVTAAELPALIEQVHSALASAANSSSVVEVVPQTPAVSIKRSVTPEHLICLEDGQKFKSLKRHLRIKYGLSPEQYRAKWNLPRDYPMVAPAYAALRANFAKKNGLGQRGTRSKAPASTKAGRKVRV